MPSKYTQEIDFQDHPLAVGTVVPSEVTAHIITTQGLQKYGLNTILLVLATKLHHFSPWKRSCIFLISDLQNDFGNITFYKLKMACNLVALATN